MTRGDAPASNDFVIVSSAVNGLTPKLVLQASDAITRMAKGTIKNLRVFNMATSSLDSGATHLLGASLLQD
jgi:hypothetical protein